MAGGYAALLACSQDEELWLFWLPPPSTHGSASALRTEWGISKSESCTS